MKGIETTPFHGGQNGYFYSHIGLGGNYLDLLSCLYSTNRKGFHRTGRKVAGAAWWPDPVLSTAGKVVHCWGLNLVVLTLPVTPAWGGEPLGLPINMRLHQKDADNLIDLAQQMLLEVTSWFPQRQFLACADGFYASLAGGELMQNQGSYMVQGFSEARVVCNQPLSEVVIEVFRLAVVTVVACRIFAVSTNRDSLDALGVSTVAVHCDQNRIHFHVTGGNLEGIRHLGSK